MENLKKTSNQETKLKKNKPKTDKTTTKKGIFWGDISNKSELSKPFSNSHPTKIILKHQKEHTIENGKY